MFFIKLTYLDSTPFWVNMHQVVSYEPSQGPNKGSVITTNLSEVTVKETVSEINACMSQ